ncbi:hypothetical protein D3C86_1374120 [compost metagenome]
MIVDLYETGNLVKFLVLIDIQVQKHRFVVDLKCQIGIFTRFGFGNFYHFQLFEQRFGDPDGFHHFQERFFVVCQVPVQMVFGSQHPERSIRLYQFGFCFVQGEFQCVHRMDRMLDFPALGQGAFKHLEFKMIFSIKCTKSNVTLGQWLMQFFR